MNSQEQNALREKIAEGMAELRAARQGAQIANDALIEARRVQEAALHALKQDLIRVLPSSREWEDAELDMVLSGMVDIAHLLLPESPRTHP